MAGDSALNPDPAVFEAAFVIDDSDEPSRAGTPKPVLPSEKSTLNGDAAAAKIESSEKRQDGGDQKKDGIDNKEAAGGEEAPGSTNQVVPATSAPAASELTPEIRQRLRKLEKLEATYPGTKSPPPPYSILSPSIYGPC